jgi:hypothetical protein
MPYTYKDVMKRLNTLHPWAKSLHPGKSLAPPYKPSEEKKEGCKIAFAVEDMVRHTTNEGWQVMLALQANGYTLAGKNCTINCQDIKQVVEKYNPSTVLVQDVREWSADSGCCKDASFAFTNSKYLADRPDIFKLTIVKDSQHNPDYHKRYADLISCNAWIVYYNPKIVCYTAPYVRPEHIIRTWHTIDPKLIPVYTPKGRKPLSALLSGAISRYYPLRQQIRSNISSLQCVDQLVHPGYHNRGSNTPNYLKVLSKYKVAICTSSIYGYALRKIVEASACGCIVITDLPDDEVMPGLDPNLIRVSPYINMNDLKSLVMSLLNEYDEERQKFFSEQAIVHFNYAKMGENLAADIEKMRLAYND